MTSLQKMTKIFAVLLVLLISTILPLPPGMRLELCFGSDGHVDLALNGCPDGGSIPHGPHSERHNDRHSDPSHVYAATHHGDCLHVPVVCGKAQELISASGKPDSHKFTRKNAPAKMPLIFSALVAETTRAHLSPNNCPVPFQDFLSPHLVSLRTVILLI